MQSIRNRFSDTTLQDDVNLESLARLQWYFCKLRRLVFPLTGG